MTNRDGVDAMCGIAGWVDIARDLRDQEPVLAQMVATMACR
jgi:asparagine synthetase B (glutamine-hydrolysing)